MAKCIRCFLDTGDTGKVCHSCMTKWKTKRLLAFDIVEKEIGKLNAENHKQFTKRLKKVEKSLT